MRSLRAALLASTLLVSATGCREHRERAGGRITVSFVGWGAPEERVVFAQALAELEREHPDVRVEYTQVPGVGYDYLNKLRLMLAAGLAPDVFYVPDGAFPEIVRSGALLDLEPLVRASTIELGEMWTTALERYRWNGDRVHEGHLYALPKDLGPMVLYYNVDLLRRRGVTPPPGGDPITWREALEKWRALTFLDGGVQRYGLTRFPYDAAVWSSGGEILSADRRSWAMTSPVAIDAFQWCADLAIREHVAPEPSRLSDASGTELFEAGLAATHIDGRWMVPKYRKLAFAWDVAPIPVPTRGAPLVTRSGSVGLAVSARSRHPKEALAVVEFLAGPRGQAKLTRAGFQLPNQRWLARTDVFLQPGDRPAHAEAFVVTAETSRPGAATETPSAFWEEVFGAYAEDVWRGDRKAKDLFPEIAPRVNQALRMAYDAKASAAKPGRTSARE